MSDETRERDEVDLVRAILGGRIRELEAEVERLKVARDTTGEVAVEIRKERDDLRAKLDRAMEIIVFLLPLVPTYTKGHPRFDTEWQAQVREMLDRAAATLKEIEE